MDEAELPDCSLLDVKCHVTNWFRDFALGALDPAFAWIAGIAFGIPPVPEGVEGLWSGVLAVTNILFVLLVLAGGGVVMAHGTVQTRYGPGEVLGRTAFAFIASNASLWISREMLRAANGISRGIAAMAINPDEAAERLHERMSVIAMEGVVFLVLILVALVVLLVVWIIADVVRIAMSIVLVVAAPALLVFHALPQTNRIAALWWRSMAGLCAIPIGQSLAFSALMKLFFEGQLRFFGHYPLDDAGGQAAGAGDGGVARAMAIAPMVLPADRADGTTPLFDLILFLVLVYIQIRIPFWVMKLVWAPGPGSSPIMALAKGVAAMILFRHLSGLKFPKPGPSWGIDLRKPRALPPGRRTPALLNGKNPARIEGGPGRRPGELPSAPPKAPRELGPGRADARRDDWRTPPPHEPGRPRPAGPGTFPMPGAERPTTGGPRPRPAGGNTAPQGRTGKGSGGKRSRSGQLELFRPGPALKTSSTRPSASSEGGPKRRWRQGVLPTPPPERVPGKRGPRRLGEVFDAPAASPRRPRPPRGQLPLFANPKKHWVQRPLPLGRVALNQDQKKRKEG
ncbi:hypothetical protein [Nocardiopsis composta]